jgi:predicted 3-demethylubiquinone-9 3-methyltransferase (glyoxalase superfamily)
MADKTRAATKQRLITHLWFDKEAKEAAQFYASVFGQGSHIKDTNVLQNTPSGSVDIVTVELLGQDFVLFSAGPLFKFNPSVSFLVACKTIDEVDGLWRKLSQGGKALMELGEYPFSQRYGWTQDKFGISWQVMFMGDREIRQRITPALMFTGAVYGKAEEAIGFYASVFRDARVHEILRYGKEEEPEKEGKVKYAAFRLEGQEFAAMESAGPHNFAFNEAISFMVTCDTQKEIDYYWEKLSADPRHEQCGWLKDKYGLSWQVAPTVLEDMLKDKDQKKVARVTEAFMQMKKFDLAALQAAYEGR